VTDPLTPERVRALLTGLSAPDLARALLAAWEERDEALEDARAISMAAEKWREIAESVYTTGRAATLRTLTEERDEARAQVAGLRRSLADVMLVGENPPDETLQHAADRVWDEAEGILRDTAEAARAHDARVRAEALRGAADAVSEQPDSDRLIWSVVQIWLRARADAIEKEAER